MEVKVKIENLSEVRAALIKSPQIVSKHINNAIKKSIFEIRNNSMDAQFKHPTGRLKGSHQVVFGNLRGEVGPTVKYAYWVHEGHHQTPGRFVPAIGKRLVKNFVQGNPFLKKAVERGEQKINQYFKDGLKNSLNEIARSAK